MKTRNTNQRLKVLGYLKSVKTHPTAEMVYNEVKKELPAITLATVYRNLNLLAEHGNILRLEINNEYRYDADTRHHQHCICKECGQIHDIYNKNISKNILSLFSLKNFKPQSVDIIYRGLCNKCYD